MEVDKCPQGLAGDVDRMFFRDAPLAKHSKHRASHKVHADPDIVSAQGDLLELDKVLVAAGHDTEFAKNCSSVFSIWIKLAALDG